MPSLVDVWGAGARRRLASPSGGPRLVAVALVLASASGCVSKSPVTFGVVLDSDGVRGATVAMEQINAAGGVNGRRIVLRNVGGATTNKARVALETAETLARDPAVLGVVGHTNSATSLAASQVYNMNRVVQIAPTSSTPIYSAAGPYSFRLVGSDIHQGLFLANEVLTRHPRPRTAVLFVNDDYGRPLRDVLVERLQQGGLTPVHDAPFFEGASDATRAEMVAALARSRPDLLLWIGRSYEYLPLVRMIHSRLPKIEVIASDGFSGGGVTNDTLHLLDGVSYVRLLSVQLPDSALGALRERYRINGWGEPTDQAILSYDAVLLLSEAVRAVGPSREEIREWVSKVGREHPAVLGASGPIAFTAEGDREASYSLEMIGWRRR